VMAAGPVSGAFGTVTQRVWPPETPQVVDACATPEPMVIIAASKASITKNRTMNGRVLGFCTCHLFDSNINDELLCCHHRSASDRGVAPSNDNSVIVGSEVEQYSPTNAGSSLRRMPYGMTASSPSSLLRGRDLNELLVRMPTAGQHALEDRRDLGRVLA
jgi:hypothetical protein